MEDLKGVRKRELKRMYQSLERQLEQEECETARMMDYILYKNLFEDYCKFIQDHPSTDAVPLIEARK